MKTLFRLSVILAASALSALSLFAQAGLLPGGPKAQFFDNNGNPLSAGRVWTYAAGTSTLLATYTDVSATSANPNPVVLDSAGRANIWLLTSALYKIRLETSASVSLWTVDNVSAGGAGVSGTFLPLSGGTLTGAVLSSGGTSLGNAGSGRFGTLYVTNLNCTGTCTGGGGSGTPGGADTNVQFNSSSAFGGSANLTWNNSGRFLSIFAASGSSPGLAVANGFIQSATGFVALPATATTYNAVQASGGGMAALSFTAADYVQSGNHSGTPPLTGGDSFHPGALYWDTGTASEKVFDGSSWQTLAAGGSTTPGGANTDVQFNNGGAFAGSTNFKWNSSAQKLLLTALSSTDYGIYQQTGYMLSDVGYAVNPATGTTFNAVQATAGGVAAKSFTGTAYVQTGHNSGPPAATNGDAFHAGALYYDDALTGMQVYNGAAWVAVGGGGGGGTPAGASTTIQFNNSGTFAGSTQLTWASGPQLLNVVGLAGTAGLNVQGGFIQSAQGFVADNSLATTYNAVQAIGGGVAAKSFTGTAYVQTGHSSGVPSLTSGDSFHAGALYWDDILTSERVFNGSVWTSLGAGGGGSPGGADTNVQFNSSSAFGGSANLTWNNSTRLLNVSTTSGVAGLNVQGGFAQAAQGFVADPALATTYNAIQAVGGGMTAKSFTAVSYLQMGTSSGIPTPTAGDSFHPGAVYWDSFAAAAKIFNGSTWTLLGAGTGGTTPGGADTNVQYNSAGVFGGSPNYTWNNSARLLNVSTTGGAAGLNVQGGFVQSDQGFVASSLTANTFNAVQAVNGGMTAKSFTATAYIQTGNSSGIPALTSGDSFHPGALYWDTSAGSMQVFNGATWSNISGGGGASLSANNSWTGTNTFNAGTTFNGAVLAGQIGANQYQVGGLNVIDSARNGSFQNVTITGTCFGCPGSSGVSSLSATSPISVSASFGAVNISCSTCGSGASLSANNLWSGTNTFNAGTNFNGLVLAGVIGANQYQVGGANVINSSSAFVGSGGVNVGGAGISAGGYNVNGGFIGQTWNLGFSSPFTINGGGAFTTLVVRGGVVVSAF